MSDPIRMVAVPVALPLKLIDTLKPLAIVAEKLKHCHVVEVCEPTADNPSRTTIPMPREWFERTADDLEAIAILMHGAGVLSEGQAATLTGLDRVEVRKQVDALTAAPVREEGGGWSAVRNVFVTYAGRFSQAARYEEAGAIADMAAHDLAALATREEAPAEARKDYRHLASKIGVVISNHGTNEQYEAWLELLRAFNGFRAQPQAREEARDCGNGHQPGCDCDVAEEDVARSKPPLREEAQPVPMRECLHCGRLKVMGCRCDYVATPPAPEAEKLRVAVRDRYVAVGLMVERAWMEGKPDHLIATAARKALAALQQDALSAAPGEAK